MMMLSYLAQVLIVFVTLVGPRGSSGAVKGAAGRDSEGRRPAAPPAAEAPPSRNPIEMEKVFYPARLDFEKVEACIGKTVEITINPPRNVAVELLNVVASSPFHASFVYAGASISVTYLPKHSRDEVIHSFLTIETSVGDFYYPVTGSAIPSRFNIEPVTDLSIPPSLQYTRTLRLYNPYPDYIVSVMNCTTDSLWPFIALKYTPGQHLWEIGPKQAKDLVQMTVVPIFPGTIEGYVDLYLSLIPLNQRRRRQVGKESVVALKVPVEYTLVSPGVLPADKQLDFGTVTDFTTVRRLPLLLSNTLATPVRVDTVSITSTDHIMHRPVPLLESDAQLPPGRSSRVGALTYKATRSKNLKTGSKYGLFTGNLVITFKVDRDSGPDSDVKAPPPSVSIPYKVLFLEGSVQYSPDNVHFLAGNGTKKAPMKALKLTSHFEAPLTVTSAQLSTPYFEIDKAVSFPFTMDPHKVSSAIRVRPSSKHSLFAGCNLTLVTDLVPSITIPLHVYHGKLSVTMHPPDETHYRASMALSATQDGLINLGLITEPDNRDIMVYIGNPNPVAITITGIDSISQKLTLRNASKLVRHTLKPGETRSFLAQIVVDEEGEGECTLRVQSDVETKKVKIVWHMLRGVVSFVRHGTQSRVTEAEPLEITDVLMASRTEAPVFINCTSTQALYLENVTSSDQRVQMWLSSSTVIVPNSVTEIGRVVVVPDTEDGSVASKLSKGSHLRRKTLCQDDIEQRKAIEVANSVAGQDLNAVIDVKVSDESMMFSMTLRLHINTQPRKAEIMPSKALEFGMVPVGRSIEKGVVVHNPSSSPLHVQLMRWAEVPTPLVYSLASTLRVAIPEPSLTADFNLLPHAVRRTVIAAGENATLGPIVFRTESSAPTSTVFVLRNSISGVEALTVSGSGGKGLLTLVGGEAAYLEDASAAPPAPTKAAKKAAGEKSPGRIRGSAAGVVLGSASAGAAAPSPAAAQEAMDEVEVEDTPSDLPQRIELTASKDAFVQFNPEGRTRGGFVSPFRLALLLLHGVKWMNTSYLVPEHFSGGTTPAPISSMYSDPMSFRKTFSFSNHGNYDIRLVKARLAESQEAVDGACAHGGLAIDGCAGFERHIPPGGVAEITLSYTPDFTSDRTEAYLCLDSEEGAVADFVFPVVGRIPREQLVLGYDTLPHTLTETFLRAAALTLLLGIGAVLALLASTELGVTAVVRAHLSTHFPAKPAAVEAPPVCTPAPVPAPPVVNGAVPSPEPREASAADYGDGGGGEAPVVEPEPVDEPTVEEAKPEPPATPEPVPAPPATVPVKQSVPSPKEKAKKASVVAVSVSPEYPSESVTVTPSSSQEPSPVNSNPSLSASSRGGEHNVTTTPTSQHSGVDEVLRSLKGKAADAEKTRKAKRDQRKEKEAKAKAVKKEKKEAPKGRKEEDEDSWVDVAAEQTANAPAPPSGPPPPLVETEQQELQWRREAEAKAELELRQKQAAVVAREKEREVLERVKLVVQKHVKQEETQRRQLAATEEQGRRRLHKSVDHFGACVRQAMRATQAEDRDRKSLREKERQDRQRIQQQHRQHAKSIEAQASRRKKTEMKPQQTKPQPLQAPPRPPGPPPAEDEPGAWSSIFGNSFGNGSSPTADDQNATDVVESLISAIGHADSPDRTRAPVVPMGSGNPWMPTSGVGAFGGQQPAAAPQPVVGNMRQQQATWGPMGSGMQAPGAKGVPQGTPMGSVGSGWDWDGKSQPAGTPSAAGDAFSDAPPPPPLFSLFSGGGAAPLQKTHPSSSTLPSPVTPAVPPGAGPPGVPGDLLNELRSAATQNTTAAAQCGLRPDADAWVPTGGAFGKPAVAAQGPAPPAPAKPDPWGGSGSGQSAGKWEQPASRAPLNLGFGGMDGGGVFPKPAGRGEDAGGSSLFTADFLNQTRQTQAQRDQLPPGQAGPGKADDVPPSFYELFKAPAPAPSNNDSVDDLWPLAFKR